MSLSQEALAEIAKVSLSTIQRIEKGAVKPRLFTLKTVADTLNLSISNLTDELSDNELNEINFSILKKINVYSLLILVFPFLNILLPYYVFKRSKLSAEGDFLAKKIISFQILWTITTIVLIILTPIISYIITGVEGYRPFPVELFLYFLLIISNIVVIIKNMVTLSSKKKNLLLKIPNIL